jgi:phospholipid/cholesterol/gamma-HCH transport system substrate-binding protein
MSPYRRNILVGVTVLAALGFLGWMLIQFGGALAAPFAPRQMDIYLVGERADGLADGSPVLFRGVGVGQIRRVYRTDDGMSIRIEAQVEESPPLPANLRGVIRSQGLIGGGASLFLELVGPPRETLTPGTVLRADYVGLDVFPTEYGELANELRETARQFRESNIINHLDQEVQRIGQVVTSIQQIVDDPQMRQDLSTSLANIRSATDKADVLAGRMEELSREASDTLSQARGTIGRTETEITALSRQVGERLTQIARLLDQFQSITAKIDQGQGTAGLLVNDTRLYETMVATVQQMQATITDLRRLVQQWEQEGVRFRLR